MLQDTSVHAYEEEVKPTLSRRQAAVRDLLMHHPYGLTNAEIAQALDWPINTVTPRTNELVHKLEVVKDMGIRTCTVTGRKAHVWALKFIPKPSTVNTQKEVGNDPQQGTIL